jgi:hypothetical protein
MNQELDKVPVVPPCFEVSFLKSENVWGDTDQYFEESLGDLSFYNFSHKLLLILRGDNDIDYCLSKKTQSTESRLA